MRTGFSLFEMLLVISIVGILAMFALPGMTAAADAAAVRTEASRIVAALDAARGAAVRLDAVASLTLTDSAYSVSAVVGIDTIAAWRRTGPAPSGVALAVPGRAILFGPAGLAMGASNRTITVSRGSATRQVVISRLGRITW